MRAKLIISILAAALVLPAATACGTGGGFFFVEDSAEEETPAEDDASAGDDALSAEAESQPDGGTAIDAEDEANAEDEVEETAEYFDETLNGDDAFDIVAQKVVTADYSGNTGVYVVADDGRVYDFGYVALDVDILLIARGDSLRVTVTSSNVVKAWDFTITGEDDAKVRVHDVIEETEEDTDETEEESGTGYGSLWWSGSGDSGN